MNVKLRRSSKKRRQRDGKRRPINVLASVMTTMNLYCGLMSIFASFGGEYNKAAYYILAGIIFDTFDGFVARLTKSTSEFGKELDSLCDVVTFGVAPAVLVFSAYIPPEQFRQLTIPATAENMIGKFSGIVLAVCAALRLARYNTFQSNRRDSFVGLPSPAAGGTIAAAVLFLQYYEYKLEPMRFGALAYYALAPLAVMLALLMVSRVLYPRNRLRSFILTPRHAFTALGIFAFVIALLDYALTRSWSIVLFPLAMSYVLFGVADSGYRWIIQKPVIAVTGNNPGGPAGPDNATGALG